MFFFLSICDVKQQSRCLGTRIFAEWAEVGHDSPPTTVQSQWITSFFKLYLQHDGGLDAAGKSCFDLIWGTFPESLRNTAEMSSTVLIP
jgi:hypothetical protein